MLQVPIMKLYTILTIFALIIDESRQNKPNIILIVADDLGWNDVGFHGSSEIRTPNIDALAYSGLILNNYYVTPICTPSRSALMTGKYPIHTGMQHGVLYGAEPRGLPLDEKILPEFFKEAGYKTRIVGKWHLGSYKKEYTPLYRGFDSHLGFWTGHQDYYDHTAVERPGWGLDMRRNMDIAYDLHGQYSTDIFTNEAKYIIETHNITEPLFLYLAHTAVHSGNPYEPLRAPDETIKKFAYIKDFARRRFAAMLSKLDDSVGVVVETLQKRQMLNNSIIVFTTDNGGPAGGFNLNAASNYPLRGVKNTLWEGGVRGAALLWSRSIRKPSRIDKQLMHISDWFPTLLQAAGIVNNKNIDGVNLWEALSDDLESPRSEILHNIDDIFGNAALTIGPWKILKGTTYNGAWDYWYGPAGRDYLYNVTTILDNPTGRALRKLQIKLDPDKVLELRNSSTIQCRSPPNQSNCQPLKETCLFNLLEDPCETLNVANKYPEIRTRLEKILVQHNKTAIAPGNKPLDVRGDPKYWNYVWTNFGDYLQNPSTIII